ncbi:hypothetical protein BKA70DRAFT_1474255 [Coprinopsis sp. MPI-PUGE-AT-0042]|nr:hypothetical protein BKA70DRAFT_1474255 [Coprinopsis sp. MPI-PUGE-AT-0042]
MVCFPLSSLHVSFLTVHFFCFAFREGLPDRLRHIFRRLPVDTSAILGLRVLQERLKPDESRRPYEILRKKAFYKPDLGSLCASRTPQAGRVKTSVWYVFLRLAHGWFLTVLLCFAFRDSEKESVIARISYFVDYRRYRERERELQEHLKTGESRTISIRREYSKFIGLGVGRGLGCARKFEQRRRDICRTTERMYVGSSWDWDGEAPRAPLSRDPG